MRDGVGICEFRERMVLAKADGEIIRDQRFVESVVADSHIVESLQVRG